MHKPAPTEHDIHDLLRHRWSPRAFAPISLTHAEVHQVMEAARWAASARNEQPWRYIVATRDDADAFARMLEPLAPSNQIWARNAGALLLAVVAERYQNTEQLNRHAAHDVGQANAMLVIQAEAMGLRTHQMGGFDPDKAREIFDIPEGYEPFTYIAIGHQAEADTLPEELAQREALSRSRIPHEAFVFQGRFGRPLGDEKP